MRPDRQELLRSVDSHMEGRPPPTLRIAHDATIPMADLPIIGIIGSLGVELDPGCFAFWVDPNELGAGDTPLETQLAITESLLRDSYLDPHRSVALVSETVDGNADTPMPSRPPAVKRSSIRLADDNVVPVVGPGGRVTLSVQSTGIFGNVAMRPLKDPGSRQHGRWRPADAVVDLLAPYFGRAATQVFLDFGYYEASWLEHQEVVRPVFIFTIESDEGAPNTYRTHVLVPCTEPERPDDGDLIDGL